jgi:hypothetical protein
MKSIRVKRKKEKRGKEVNEEGKRKRERRCGSFNPAACYF